MVYHVRPRYTLACTRVRTRIIYHMLAQLRLTLYREEDVEEEHIKRHRYLTIRRHEVSTTPEVSDPTSVENVSPVSPAPPDSNDSTNYDSNPCEGKYCGAGRECQLSEDGTLAICVCAKRCARRHRPVCASDGKVYANHCELHRAACHLDAPLTASRLMRCLHRDDHQEAPKALPLHNAVTASSATAASAAASSISSSGGSEEERDSQVKYDSKENLVEDGYDVDDCSAQEYEIMKVQYTTRFFSHTYTRRTIGIDLLCFSHTGQSAAVQSRQTVGAGQPQQGVPGEHHVLALRPEQQRRPGARRAGARRRARGPRAAQSRLLARPHDQLRRRGSRRPTEHQRVLHGFQQAIHHKSRWRCVSSRCLGGLAGQEPGDQSHTGARRRQRRDKMRRNGHTAAAAGLAALQRRSREPVRARAIPEVRVTPRLQSKRPGEEASMRCHVVGEPLPRVEWLKNDEPLQQRSEGRKYEVVGNGTRLVIRGIGYADTGAYMCQASSVGGVTRDISSLVVQEQPTPIMCSQVVTTDKYPVELQYVPDLDQVWVLNWRSETDMGVKTIQVIRDAAQKKKHRTVHPEPIDGQFDLVRGLYIPDPQDIGHAFKYGYVTHTNQRGMYKLDLANMRYTRSADLAPYNCVPVHIQFPALYGFVILQCEEPITGRPTGQLLLDYVTDTVLGHKPELLGRPTVSPDSRHLVTIDRRDNSVVLIVEEILPTGLNFAFDVKTTLNISDITFYPSQTTHGYDLYASSMDNKEDILFLNLASGKVEMITGVGKAMPVMYAKWGKPNRPIVQSGVFGRYMVSPSNEALFVLNGETRTVNCEIGGLVQSK
ncbi:unnamed protein product [Trichogramma brassicae]|uniref:Kazal-like domain-containing protein n=1 Tax=Trichogramma brassicae TaxID=86971 RepID=A0A6H5IKT6_9HYME|nr:unnamed protein product [Trichogramma brassicae]